jgi:hypothetical protein
MSDQQRSGRKQPSPGDIIFWQIAGVLIGATPGTTVALLWWWRPFVTEAAWPEWLICTAPLFVLGGGIAGTVWGARRRAGQPDPDKEEQAP